MSGLFNTISNAFQVLLAGVNGSANVGHKGVTVAAKLDAIDLNIAAISTQGIGVIPNNKDAGNRNFSILGDSISHGAFALNSFMNCWVRIFQRCFNAEVGASGYGFTPLLTLGADVTTTTEVHSVNFTGTAWTGRSSGVHPEGAIYPNGLGMRAGGADSKISITVPFFQNRALIYYGTMPGGGGFTVKVNGVLGATVSTNAASGYATTEVAMTDNGYGDCVILIESTSAAANPVDICGISYLSAGLEPVLNNFSQSGRRLRHVAESVIDKMTAESAILMVCLGHNDQGDADSNQAYYDEFMQRITWLTTYANARAVRLVVPDFCWTTPATSRTRIALKKLATDTGGLYIDLPSAIFEGGVAQTEAYLVDTLKMWYEASHPNKAGHQFIGETIARRMGFACASKYDAVRFHDWAMPVALKPENLVFNVFSATSALASSYRRNGNTVEMKFFVRKAGGGSFPAGTVIISDAFRAITEVAGAQGVTQTAVVRDTTGAAVSTVVVTSAGQVTLNVHDGAWITNQSFVVRMPVT